MASLHSLWPSEMASAESDGRVPWSPTSACLHPHTQIYPACQGDLKAGCPNLLLWLPCSRAWAPLPTGLAMTSVTHSATVGRSSAAVAKPWLLSRISGWAQQADACEVRFREPLGLFRQRAMPQAAYGLRVAVEREGASEAGRRCVQLGGHKKENLKGTSAGIASCRSWLQRQGIKKGHRDSAIFYIAAVFKATAGTSRAVYFRALVRWTPADRMTRFDKLAFPEPSVPCGYVISRSDTVCRGARLGNAVVPTPIQRQCLA